MSDRAHEHMINGLAGLTGLAMLTNLDIVLKVVGMIVALLGIGCSVAKEAREWLDRRDRVKRKS